ncbi:MAG: hypothetical protein K0R39_3497 [Symbiobacteriaceae bacterium]|jgi:hypothetical protein|nr:hypothetical protein [Symbiobacteriaceae bacterium]
MQELAEEVAAGRCVWFLGAGLSLDAEMPSVSQLTWMLLDNTFRYQLGPWTEAELVDLWEAMKRLLIGRAYENAVRSNSGLCLRHRTDVAGIDQELRLLKAHVDGPNTPVWADRLLNLSRIAELLQRSVPKGNEADVVLAQLVGFEKQPDERSEVWEKEPQLAHHLLARLAQEGRIETMFTTNYDELVEKACTDAGVAYNRIADQTELQKAKEGLRYYKIHGCRGRYLEALKCGDRERLKQASGDLVLTDRQLQDWRDEHWARRKVEAELQECPFFFIGYSASEAVLSRTFNRIFHELSKGPGRHIFAAPELSFGLYQAQAELDCEYDPLEAKRVIDAYGRPLLQALYPAVMGRYFEAMALEAPAPDWAISASEPPPPDGARMQAALRAAARLLKEWAEAVEDEEIQRTSREIRSPFQIINDTLENQFGTEYLPLAPNAAEYKRLVTGLARVIAHHFAQTNDLGSIRGTPAGVTLHLSQGAQTIDIAFIPDRLRGRVNTKISNWLQGFMEIQEPQGESGNYAIIFGAHISAVEVQAVWNLYRNRRPHWKIQVWTEEGLTDLSDGGDGNV